MIVYDLICSRDHGFEAWFRDAAGCDAQIGAGEVVCPACGDTKLRKAPSAPGLMKSRGDSGPPPVDPVRLRAALLELRKHVESNADYVGDRFPEEARRIHYGEVEERAIYGEASADEARELRDEGVEVVAIPWADQPDS